MNHAVGGTMDTVVIGSGFGGAIAACRLAQSGRRVTVLERGQRRSGNQFPRLGTARLHDWMWTARWNGFWDLREFRRILTLTSSGVGGGSHAYANVHLRAPEQSFRDGWPNGLSPTALAPYYERVESMLHVRPLPDFMDLPKRRAYLKAGRAIGVEGFKPNLAVYFDDDPTSEVNKGHPRPTRDPYNLGIDVMQSPCLHTGECDLGCRFAAKNTVDLNYLALAEQRHGAVIMPLTEAVAIAPEEEGYRVFYRDRTTFERHSIWAPQVVVAGGTINTNELLLRCRDEFNLLPKVSPALGTHFSGNGDFLCGAMNTAEALDPWYGPVITTALPYTGDTHFYLQEGGFAPDLAFLASAMHPDSAYIGKLLRGPIGHIAKMRVFYQELGRLAQEHQSAEIDRQLPANTMIFLGMGQDASDGRICLQHRYGRRPKLNIEWDHASSMPLIQQMESEFRRICAELGGVYAHNPLWGFLGRLITVHPLGGCAIADDPADGVCNPYGEVWGYPNLFITDGSTVPRALGPNPSLTISALAERSMEHAVAA